MLILEAIHPNWKHHKRNLNKDLLHVVSNQPPVVRALPQYLRDSNLISSAPRRIGGRISLLEFGLPRFQGLATIFAR